jgi:hypothetical protein
MTGGKRTMKGSEGMRILGIDPGPKESGYVIWDGARAEAGTMENEALRHYLVKGHRLTALAIERIRGYGQVAGNDTYETCEWIGRFDISAREAGIPIVKLIPRKDIKNHLCGNTTTNDTYIRQALIDKLEDLQYVKYNKKGNKDVIKGGRLFGISGHGWAALAVAVTCADTMEA